MWVGPCRLRSWGRFPEGHGFQWAGGLQFRGLECQALAFGSGSAEEEEHRTSGDPEHDHLSFSAGAHTAHGLPCKDALVSGREDY